MRYKVGDYVRVKSNLEGKEFSYVTDNMRNFCGKLGRIIKVKCSEMLDNTDDDVIDYYLSFDKDNPWIEDYAWGINAFEYRLGNYEDNNIENHRFKYVIGYKTNKDSVKINKFNGFIENFAPCGKSVFVGENGKTLVLPWELIEYIVPIDD